MIRARVLPITVLVCFAALTAEAAVATWDRNPEPDVTGYVVSYGTQPGVHTTSIDVGNVVRYEFFPPPGQRYYVVVQAYNSTGNLSSKSSESVYDAAATAPVNRAPALAQPANQTSVVGTPVWLALTASDPDGDGMTYWAQGLPAGLAIQPNGVISGTPSAAGTSSVTVTVWDGLLSTSASFTWTVNATAATNTSIPISADFDGDGRADFGTWSSSTGHWRLRLSTQGYGSVTETQWGTPGDLPLAADYDGDRRSDIAVYRPSNGVWYVLLSTTNFQQAMGLQWGDSGDRPIATDYDNDGRADLVLPRFAAFVISLSGSNFTQSRLVFAPELLASDVAVPGDFDGDGRADLAAYRPATGEWRRWLSGSNFAVAPPIQWGVSTDIPVVADYDGDRRADIAVYRPSEGIWYVLLSSTNYQRNVNIQFGGAEDRPFPMDFDSDGHADLGLLRSGGGFSIRRATIQ